MEQIKIHNVEELLTIPANVKCVEISQNDVIRYIYINRTNENVQINLQELRNVYVESINQSYMNKQYSNDLVLDKKDIKRVCIV